MPHLKQNPRNCLDTFAVHRTVSHEHRLRNLAVIGLSPSKNEHAKAPWEKHGKGGVLYLVVRSLVSILPAKIILKIKEIADCSFPLYSL